MVFFLQPDTSIRQAIAKIRVKFFIMELLHVDYSYLTFYNPVKISEKEIINHDKNTLILETRMI
jgi:hypothetical protein